MTKILKKVQIRTKAVIFDLDGVITNTMPDHYRAWKAVFAREGIVVSHLDVYQREGQRGITSVMEIFQSRGKAMTRSRAIKILRAKEKLFKRIARRRFIPGARKFLRDLHAQQFRLALVTGTSRHELNELLPTYLLKLFHVVVTGSDVKRGKPHPEPFHKALKLLRLSAKDSIVLENSPFGIISAKKAGLKCLALETSLPRDYLKGADIIFSAIPELRNRTILMAS